MKHENCMNCEKGKWIEGYVPITFLAFLFQVDRERRDRIRCSETGGDISPEQYHQICNLGCGSFKDNHKNG